MRAKKRTFQNRLIYLIVWFSLGNHLAHGARPGRATLGLDHESSVHISAMVGLNQLRVSTRSEAGLAYGVGIKDHISKNFSLKVYASGHSRDMQNLKENFWQVALAPAFEMGGFFVGPEISYGRFCYQAQTKSSQSFCSASLYGVGGNLGFNIPLSDHHSIGPDLHYTIFFPAGSSKGIALLQGLIALNFIF